MPARSAHRRRRALERQQKGYPAALGFPSVPDQEWVGQLDAAERLGVSLVRLAFLIQSGQLEPVHNVARHAGVSRRSLERQERRRVGAGLARRAWIFAVDCVHSLARGA